MVEPRERRKSTRRGADRRKSDRRSDALTPALQDPRADDVEQALSLADARIDIRCSPETKAEMEAIANRYGLTLTAYILRLHNLAVRRLQEG